MVEHDLFSDHQLPGKVYFKGVRIISDQIDQGGLATVWDALETVLRQNIAGDIVEFGCYVGTTSLLLRKLLDTHQQSAARELHVYDSFEGLPEKSEQDTSAAGVDFKAGKLFVRRAEFIQQFHSADLQLPVIHKGWFGELTEQDVPSSIAFAFLDGDFYGSIISSLRLVWPCMQAGGMLLVDDYQREALPGVSRALHDFFQAKSVTIKQRGNIAIIAC